MGKKLFVGNLSYTATSDEVRNFFTKVGNCTSATVMTDRETGRSRGFAFVEMETDEQATRAVAELNGADLGGRKVNVSEARERGERPAGGFAPRGARPSFGGGGGRDSRFEGGGGGGGDYPVNAPSQPFRKEKGSRRGLRGKKRSL